MSHHTHGQGEEKFQWPPATSRSYPYTTYTLSRTLSADSSSSSSSYDSRHSQSSAPSTPPSSLPSTPSELVPSKFPLSRAAKAALPVVPTSLIARLPHELLERVLSLCDKHSIISAAEVCHAWRAIALSTLHAVLTFQLISVPSPSSSASWSQWRAGSNVSRRIWKPMGRERALLDTIARAGSPAAAPNLTGSVMNADELCVKRCELVRHISVTFAKQDTRVGAGYRCEEIPVCDEWLATLLPVLHRFPSLQTFSWGLPAPLSTLHPTSSPSQGLTDASNLSVLLRALLSSCPQLQRVQVRCLGGTLKAFVREGEVRRVEVCLEDATKGMPLGTWKAGLSDTDGDGNSSSSPLSSLARKLRNFHLQTRTYADQAGGRPEEEDDDRRHLRGEFIRVVRGIIESYKYESECKSKTKSIHRPQLTRTHPQKCQCVSTFSPAHSSTIPPAHRTLTSISISTPYLSSNPESESTWQGGSIIHWEASNWIPAPAPVLDDDGNDRGWNALLESLDRILMALGG